MVYVITGGPATGKGTRSDILSKALNIPHISTGDILRDVAQTNEKINKKLSRGELISDEIITELLEERLSKEDCPPKVEGICDVCGGELSVRTDDTRETLQKRINTYKENSKDILNYYKEKGILKTVDSSSHPERMIKEALED